MENKKIKVSVDLSEFEPKSKSGIGGVIFAVLLSVVSMAAVICGGIMLEMTASTALSVVILVLGILLCCLSPFVFMGLKVIKPNEALVLTLFGKYHGTLKKAGFYLVNPFCGAVAPPAAGASRQMQVSSSLASGVQKANGQEQVQAFRGGAKISLKNMTMNNERQKINDKLGNPIIIGIVIIWRVTDTVKAIFNVDDYIEFLSIQCDSALRNIVRTYPYDCATDGESENEKSLRGSSVEISDKLCAEIQEKVDIAGLEVMEARITHLAYAPEIAAAMLQRQQASAVVDARQLIVDGAVGMVEMALDKLSEKNVVHLDEERKAAMVSNLLVVLCGNKDAQPIVNSGSIY